MELREAIDKVRNILEYQQNINLLEDIDVKAFELLIQTAEAVEKMRGNFSEVEPAKLGSENSHEYRFYELGEKRMREKCAAAYVANLPTVEEIRNVLTSIYTKQAKYMTDRLMLADMAKEIHDLFAGKASKT